MIRAKRFANRPCHQVKDQTGILPEFSRNLAFAQRKKGAISGHVLLVLVCFGKKTCAQPWYARKSGNSPAQKEVWDFKETISCDAPLVCGRDERAAWSPKMVSKCSNLCGHLERCRMPDIESSRKKNQVGSG